MPQTHRPGPITGPGGMETLREVSTSRWWGPYETPSRCGCSTCAPQARETPVIDPNAAPPRSPEARRSSNCIPTAFRFSANQARCIGRALTDAVEQVGGAPHCCGYPGDPAGFRQAGARYAADVAAATLQELRDQLAEGGDGCEGLDELVNVIDGDAGALASWTNYLLNTLSFECNSCEGWCPSGDWVSLPPTRCFHPDEPGRSRVASQQLLVTCSAYRERHNSVERPSSSTVCDPLMRERTHFHPLGLAQSCLNVIADELRSLLPPPDLFRDEEALLAELALYREQWRSYFAFGLDQLNAFDPATEPVGLCGRIVRGELGSYTAAQIVEGVVRATYGTYEATIVDAFGRPHQRRVAAPGRAPLVFQLPIVGCVPRSFPTDVIDPIERTVTEHERPFRV